MDHKDTEAAEKRYGSNGWSKVEQLVLYRLDICEDNICAVKGDIEKLADKRDQDVKDSQEQRKEHYEAIQANILTLNEALTAYMLSRAEAEKTMVEKEAAIKQSIDKNTDRLSRVEKIIYSVVGTGGLFLLKEVLERVF